MAAIKYRKGYRHPVENEHLDGIDVIQARSFRARYPGRCGICRGRVYAGDDVIYGTWRDRDRINPTDRNLRHTACAISAYRYAS